MKNATNISSHVYFWQQNEEANVFFWQYQFLVDNIFVSHQCINVFFK